MSAEAFLVTPVDVRLRRADSGRVGKYIRREAQDFQKPRLNLIGRLGKEPSPAGSYHDHREGLPLNLDRHVARVGGAKIERSATLLAGSGSLSDAAGLDTLPRANHREGLRTGLSGYRKIGGSTDLRSPQEVGRGVPPDRGGRGRRLPIQGVVRRHSLTAGEICFQTPSDQIRTTRSSEGAGLSPLPWRGPHYPALPTIETQ